MPAISLRAHFDGEVIRLDEQCEIPAGAALMVTVLDSERTEEERQDEIALARASLARAYGEDEPEYGDEDLKS